MTNLYFPSSRQRKYVYTGKAHTLMAQGAGPRIFSSLPVLQVWRLILHLQVQETSFLSSFRFSCLLSGCSPPYCGETHCYQRSSKLSRALCTGQTVIAQDRTLPHMPTTVSYGRGKPCFLHSGHVFWRRKTDEVFPTWEKPILLVKSNESSYFKLYYMVTHTARTPVDTCRLTTSCAYYVPGCTYCTTYAHVCTM